MEEIKLKKYAEAIVKVGANVQAGQEVFINANVGNEAFVKLVVEEAYKAGSKRVYVDWTSDAVNKLNFQYSSTEVLSKVSPWVIREWEYKRDTNPVFIWIESDDPDALGGIDPEKIMTVSKETRAVIRPIRKPMENKYQWVIAATPSKSWAHKLFPEMEANEAIEKLWDLILKCARCDGEDPIGDWNKHNAFLKEKCKWLNDMDIDYLEYKSSNGTDFKVSLHKDTNFMAGLSMTLFNVGYNPNMPSEECFISPIKESACGVVYATKPLSLNGVVLKDFGFRFENGNVVEVLAKDEVAKKMLTELVSSDEGARRLGEVALVPFDSPINKSDVLFYNTLFDENACCHLAVGMGFKDTIRDFEKKSKEEIDAVGINDSMIHVDFMIGSADLNIVATLRDGSKVQIFEKGTWAK